jgi:diaminopimelate decarboxylase
MHTEIILEPGRAIVGNAGIFVTKVEFLKQNSDHAMAFSNCFKSA